MGKYEFVDLDTHIQFLQNPFATAYKFIAFSRNSKL